MTFCRCGLAFFVCIYILLRILSLVRSIIYRFIYLLLLIYLKLLNLVSIIRISHDDLFYNSILCCQGGTNKNSNSESKDGKVSPGETYSEQDDSEEEDLTAKLPLADKKKKK